MSDRVRICDCTSQLHEKIRPKEGEFWAEEQHLVNDNVDIEVYHQKQYTNINGINHYFMRKRPRDLEDKVFLTYWLKIDSKFYGHHIKFSMKDQDVYGMDGWTYHKKENCVHNINLSYEYENGKTLTIINKCHNYKNKGEQNMKGFVSYHMSNKKWKIGKYHQTYYNKKGEHLRFDVHLNIDHIQGKCNLEEKPLYMMLRFLVKDNILPKESEEAEEEREEEQEKAPVQEEWQQLWDMSLGEDELNAWNECINYEFN